MSRKKKACVMAQVKLVVETDAGETSVQGGQCFPAFKVGTGMILETPYICCAKTAVMFDNSFVTQDENQPVDVCEIRNSIAAGDDDNLDFLDSLSLGNIGGQCHIRPTHLPYVGLTVQTQSCDSAYGVVTDYPMSPVEALGVISGARVVKRLKKPVWLIEDPDGEDMYDVTRDITIKVSQVNLPFFLTAVHTDLDEEELLTRVYQSVGRTVDSLGCNMLYLGMVGVHDTLKIPAESDPETVALLPYNWGNPAASIDADAYANLRQLLAGCATKTPAKKRRVSSTDRTEFDRFFDGGGSGKTRPAWDKNKHGNGKPDPVNHFV